MTFPLATALAVAGPATPALLATASVVAGFLAHEPLLVLLGMRGPRARRELGRTALLWLTVAGAAAAVTAAAAIWMTPAEHRWLFAIPVVPLLPFAAAIAARSEKSWYPQVAVAVAFSCAAIPVAAAAGATVATAFSIAIPFALTFVAATLAVRVVILRVRGGGNPRAAMATRRAAFVVGLGGAIALAALTLAGPLPLRALAAATPGLLIALAVALFPPPPARLRAVGWTLVAASVLTTAILVI